MSENICNALRDLVPFVQFKKHPWRSVTFSKVAGNFTKRVTLPWVFFTFLKLYKWYQTAKSVSYVSFRCKFVNPFQANVPFLFPLKKSED